MKSRKHKFGVTLIEMVIVVAIIAMLTTMVISVVSRIDNQAKEKGLANIFALLESALQEYHDFKGYFPSQPEQIFNNAAAHSETLYRELQSLPASRAILENINATLIKDYFNSVIVPPMPEIYDPWGTALDYRYVSGNNFPELISAGPDKIFDTADDMSSRTQ